MPKGLMLACVLVGLRAFAADGTWNYASTATPDGLTPETAADWLNDDNWLNGVVPSAADDVAFLVDKTCTTDMSGYVRYIRVPEDGLVLGGISSRRGANLTVFGGPITMAGSAVGLSESYATFPAFRDEVAGATYCNALFFNDIVFGPNTYINRCQIAGKVRPASAADRIVVADALRFVPYRSADSNAETIEDPSYNGIISIGSGGISYLAPSGADATSGHWRTTEGSPFIVRVGAAHAFAAGQTVSGSGVAEGSYVKRIWAADRIELSQSAAATSEDPETGTELRFAAFKPHVVQNINGIQVQGADTTAGLSFMKLRADDDVTYYVDRLAVSEKMTFGLGVDRYNSHYNILTDSVFPAHVVFRNVSELNKNPLYLIAADVEFDGGTAETTVSRLGLGLGHLPGENANPGTASATLTVGEGKTTVVDSLEEFSGNLVKKGVGRLVINLNCTPRNATVDVVAGSLTFNGANANLSALAVAADATLELGAGVSVVVTTATIAPGAALKLDAGSVLRLPEPPPNDVTISGEGKIEIYQSVSTCALQTGAPFLAGDQFEPGVKGTPAFWVTADSLVGETPAGTVTLEDGKNYVSRWNDCRAADAGGALFATNIANRPYLVTDGARPYVKVPACGGKSTTSCLVWSAALTNICTVFYVLDNTDGYGMILGANTRAGVTDYMAGSVSYSHALTYWNGSTGCNMGLADARASVYVDGVECTRNYAITTKGVHVIEMTGVSDMQSDSFDAAASGGTWSGRWDVTGNERIHEYIIYTNRLSHVDRRNIHRYLLDKYGITPPLEETVADLASRETRIDAVPTAQAGVCNVYSVDAGADATAVTVDAGARFEKVGEGTLYVGDMAAAASLSVRAGEVVLNAVNVADLSVPTGAAFHVDASVASTLTTVPDDTRGVEVVTEWRDPVSGKAASLLFPSSTNRPYLVENAVNDLPTIDFGPALANISNNGYSKNTTSPCLYFPILRGIKAVFEIYGSRGGGNAILGGTAGRNDSWTTVLNNKTTLGIWRDVQAYPGDLSLPLITSKGNTSNGHGADEIRNPKMTRVKRNGSRVDPLVVPMTGDYDLISIETVSTNMESDVFGGIHYAHQVGGMQLGEFFAYQRPLGISESRDLEAYLQAKWFNRTTPFVRGASVDELVVSSGARVTVSGGGLLTVAKLSGTGTIVGDVAVAADGELAVEVVNGALQPLSVTGALTLPETGTLRVTGDVGSLAPGRYTLIANAGLVAGSMAGWDVQASSRPRRLFRLICEDGALKADVFARGTAFIFR